MTSTIFPARAEVTAPVQGQRAQFPIGRIYCVGRNYAAHAREMGRDPDREPPFFFLKDADAYVGNGAEVEYPPGTTDFHHEIELVVAIGQEGFAVSESEALSLVYGYAVGIDLTRRDLQLQAREQGRPWCTGKNFPQSAPMGFIKPAQSEDFSRGAITLSVDGELKQSSDVSKLIWNVPETIVHLSKLYRLRPGDLIFTGTPEGVGPISRGQRLVGEIEGLPSIRVMIV